MNDSRLSAQAISTAFAAIYQNCHPVFSINLSHQSIRALQYIATQGNASVQEVAGVLGCAQNTASEIVRRLADKELVSRQRRQGNERVVELRLTERGQEVLAEQTGLDVEKLAERLEGVSEAEREVIQRSFEQLLRLVREEGE